MRLPIVRCCLGWMMFFLGGTLSAQTVQNPLEWAALIEGNDAINSEISSQIKGQTATSALQNTIAAEFSKIHEWEKKYSGYLQTVSGYASSLKAATHIYDDAVIMLLRLGNLKSAVAANPQGVLATMNFNSLYLEAATELVSVFNLIRDALDKGGRENMLNGAERSSILWEINDRLESFNKKLNQLAFCIRYYTMVDVWNSYTAGLFDRSVSTIARQAHDRWKRAYKAAH